MKKLMSFMLAMLMLLTLAACSGNVPSSAASDDVPIAEPTEEPTPKVGNTVHGQLCNLTVQSVEVVDKIEKAVKQVKYMSVQSGPSGMILSNPITTYLDLTAAKGCSIVKISFSFEYLGKSNGVLNFDKIELDYDKGYIFDRSFMTGHIVPDLNTGVANIENPFNPLYNP